MRAIQCHSLRILFVCISLLPCYASERSASSKPVASANAETQASSMGAKPAVHLAANPTQGRTSNPPVVHGNDAGKSPATRLSLAGKMATQPLEFFPVANPKDGARFVATGAGYSLTLGDASMVLTSHRALGAEAGSGKAMPTATKGGVGTLTLAPQPILTETSTVEFVGANRDSKPEGLEPSTAYANFMIGNDPAKWRSHVTGYDRVRYTNLYPGIDLVYHGEIHHKLEYDLAVAPGADPQQIRLRVSGDDEARIDQDGDLELDGPEGAIRLDRPMLYQNIQGGKKAIIGGFVQLARNEFGFRAMGYDSTKLLIIDPTINLLYSTYLGGNHDDEALDITVDSVGNTYLTGYTGSANFLVSANAVQQVGSWTNGGFNAFVMKFDVSGTLLFSTMLGGTSANYAGDQGEGIRVDPNGTVYVTGYTQSSNFPVTSNALQATLGGGKDVFFAALSGDGSQLIYSTYLGGAQDEDAYRMVEDANGAIWLAGSALGTGLPVTTGVYQSKPNGAANGFIAKLGFNSAAAQPLTINALTFLGGSSSATGLVSGQAIDEAFTDGFEDIAFDSAGNVYVAGATTSSDFPSTANAYQSPAYFALSGDGTCQSPKPYSLPVISELSSDLKTLIYSTTISGKTGTLGGGSFGWGTNCRQYANTVHPDGHGNIWVLGYSTAADFPTTGNALSAYPGSNSSNITVTELTPGSQATALIYSSYLGSVSGSDAPRGVWDGAGNIWISALAGSGDWPGVNPSTSLTPLPTSFAIPPNNPTITELSPDGTKILYATYLGGTKGSPYQGGQGGNGRFMPTLDANGNLHLAGSTTFIDYPLTPTAFQSVYADGFGSPSGSDAVYTVLGTGAIGTLSTSTGGNTGDATVTITGSGFVSGATCTLVSGGTTITATSGVVNSTGTGITCSFALNGAAIGSYDISVVNPNGGGTFTKQGGFTVEAAIGPKVWVNIVGRSVVRFNAPTIYTITYGNTGDTDAVVVPLYITIPDGITASLLTPLAPVPIQPGSNPNTIPVIYEVNGAQVIPLDVARIPAGGSGFVQVQLTVPSSITSFDIVASHSGPWAYSLASLDQAVPVLSQSNAGVSQFSELHIGDLVHPHATTGSTSSISNEALSCVADQVNLSFQVVTTISGPAGSAANCAVSSAGLVGSVIGNIVNPPDGSDNTSQIISAGQLTASISQATLNCAAAAGALSPPGLVVSTAINIIQLALQIAQTAKDCSDAQKPKDPQNKNGTAGASNDPNYKAGPVGDASASQYMAPGKAFTYSLGFENEATATLPAAKVVITDQLDPTKVDLSTLSLGSITIGATTITPPAHTNNYNTTYNLSSSLNVRIQGSLNQSTGLLRWTFTSIDPTTGQPPTDPTVGFLPPDTDGIVGQGGVLFNVMPKSGQTTGTQITNTATVIFDANQPINTPAWMNTLDVDLPVSKVAALPTTESATFPVSWSGTDQGSGITSYDIYVSDNGGAFTLWQSAVTATSASYSGTVGHAYGFYSIATDGAGNVQAAKSSADASTTVTPPTPLVSATTLTASSASVASGSSVKLIAVVTPPSGTTTIPTGTVTFLDGTTALGAPVTLDGTGTATLTSTTLPVGTDSITAQYGGDTVFASSTSVAVSVVVGAPNFSLSLSPTSVSVASGASGTTTITATPVFGFASAITFACSGLPAHATCTFSPAMVTPSGSTASTTTLTIATNVATASLQGDLPNQQPSQRKPLLCIVLLGAISLLRVGRRYRALSRSARNLTVLTALLLTLAGVTVMGCGGGSPKKTPAGTSTVTISATGGSQTQTTTVSLTVQ